VLEFANIAGPPMSLELDERSVRNDRSLGAKSPRGPADHVVDKQGDVPGTFPERRDEDLDDAEPIIEIFAKASLHDHRFEILVGGGNDASIGALDTFGTHGLEFPILEDPEQFALEVRRRVADLVETN
jgi:hypothetical protein